MSTLSASARPAPRAVAEEPGLAAIARSWVVALATLVTLLALALLPLLSPAWVHSAIHASGGAVHGATAAQSLALSDMTVHELLFGPGTFAMTYDAGRPLYGADEVAHMRDVRLVLYGFLALAAVSAIVVAVALVRGAKRATWSAIAAGGAVLAVGLVALGVFAAVAFGAAFELFHRLFFPGGNWSFDPAHSNLVSLYPLGFWQLSAAALGILGVAGGLAAWLVGRRMAGRA
jgi:integral membrane protein (TIGR01906 family)